MVHDEGPVETGRRAGRLDDERVVSGAGIALVATLAERLGIERLAQRFVRLRSNLPGSGNAGRRVMALLYAMALGVDSIKDANVLRDGRTDRTRHRRAARGLRNRPRGREGRGARHPGRGQGDGRVHEPAR